MAGRPGSAAEIEEGSLERHVGKTAVLGCGFGMGPKKYRDTVKAPGEEIDEATAERVVSTYRNRNRKIVFLWRELEAAALTAVRHPGLIVPAGRNDCVRYVVRGKFLWCALPSGRLLCYPQPRIEKYVWGTMEDGTKCKRAVRDRKNFTPDSDPQDAVEVSVMEKGKWIRRSLYGGLQTENVAQAVARDLMAEAMLRVEAAGYPVVLTVHDEVLAEVPCEHGTLDDFCQLMQERPGWGTNIPVVVKGWEGERYRK
jgi:DNA polymerase